MYMSIFLRLYVCVVSVCVCMHVQAPMRTCMCVYRMFAVCFGSEGLAVETCEAHVPVLALFALHELQSKTTTSLLLEFENDCGERGICGPQILVAVTHTHTSRLRQFTTAEGGSGTVQSSLALQRHALEGQAQEHTHVLIMPFLLLGSFLMADQEGQQPWNPWKQTPIP